MTTMSRRGFLRGTVALGAGAILYTYANGWRIVSAQAGAEVRQLRLVHTNDHHSRIEPASFTIARVNDSSVRRNLGGVARRKTLFDSIRADSAWAARPADQGDKLFLDAGDVFQGTLYFNLPAAQGGRGQADLFFYNRLGYHAQAIGNHEFDLGDQPLADYIKAAAFPVLAANISAAAGSPLAALYVEEVPAPATPGAVVGKWGKRTVVTLPSGQKVGIFGLTTVETENIASPSDAISFDPNYASIANAQAAALRAAGCDTVIALTHIGFQADKTLAAQLSGVNVVVGGHSHTPLLPAAPEEAPRPFGTAPVDVYPQLIPGADGKNVLVVQDWQWGLWVGDLVIGLDADGAVASVGASTTVRPVWADGIADSRDLLPGEGAEIAPDAAFKAKIDTDYKPAVVALGSTVVGRTTVELSNASARSGEGLLGNLIADAIRARALQFADNEPAIPVVAIVNGGGIRTSIDAGEITVGELLEVQPFGNTLARVDVTGAQLRAALENGLSALQPGAALDAARNPVGGGRFPNVSGLRFTYNPYGPAAQPAQPATDDLPALPARPGGRIVSVEVLEGSGATARYVPLDLEKTYRVATLNFIVNGGDGYGVFTTDGDAADPAVGGGSGQLDSGLLDVDVFADYIRALPSATYTPPATAPAPRIVVQATVFLPQIERAADVLPAGQR